MERSEGIRIFEVYTVQHFLCASTYMRVGQKVPSFILFLTEFFELIWERNSVSTKLPFQSHKVLLYVYILCMLEINCEINMFKLIKH